MPMSRHPFALPYYGGKSAASGNGLGAWIASHLPSDHGYCEPFSGMLGVLLQRPASPREIANDADARIVNWWRVIRDRPDELLYFLERTPHAEAELPAQAARLDDPDPVRQAMAVHYVLMHSMHAGLGGNAGTYRPNFTAVAKRKRDWNKSVMDRIRHRIQDVELLARPAEAILESLAPKKNWVIYCDPPYLDADTSQYGIAHVDRPRLEATLQDQTSRVAISGYGAEWDALGWRKVERRINLTAYTRKGPLQSRTECLWLNFPVEGLFGYANVG